jgi:hypothetical protein
MLAVVSTNESWDFKGNALETRAVFRRHKLLYCVLSWSLAQFCGIL